MIFPGPSLSPAIRRLIAGVSGPTNSRATAVPVKSCSTSALNVGIHLNHRYYDQDPQSGQLHLNPHPSFDAMRPLRREVTRAPAID